MYPRLSFDISWSDLLWVARQCVWSTKPEPTLPGDSHEAVITLSVRSAFDLLLSALELPPGSEVLISEITVPHMRRILEEHQLVPVAVPVDQRTLAVAADDVIARLTDRSRMLVVAPLFGTQMPLDDLGQLCHEHQLLLVQDSAQALVSGVLSRDTVVDISLYSFGPIKTATALGGGVALVKDESLRERMKQYSSEWPSQSTSSYLARLTKISLLKLLSQPALFSLVVWLINRIVGDADAFVGNSARGFPDDQLFAALRQRPCQAMQQLICRRLRLFNELQIAERGRRGQKLCTQLPAELQVAGGDNPTHTYWVFPLICPEPLKMVAQLREAGYDASQISGLTVLAEPAEGHWFERTVFVPVSPSMPEPAVKKLASILQKC